VLGRWAFLTLAPYQAKTNDGVVLCNVIPGPAYRELQALQSRTKSRATSDEVDQP